MGWKFEVMEWVCAETGFEPFFHYTRRYSGNSFIKALLMMRKLKKDGAGCVKLEWR